MKDVITQLKDQHADLTKAAEFYERQSAHLAATAAEGFARVTTLRAEAREVRSAFEILEREIAKG